MIKAINITNWIIAVLIIITTGPVLYSAQIIFVPEFHLTKPAVILSIFFFINIIYFSMHYRLKNKTDEGEINKLLSLRFNKKPMFTDYGKRKIRKSPLNRTITFYILPFVALIASILLYFTVTQTIPGLYTQFRGTPHTINSILLSKKVHSRNGSSRARYSLDFKEFNKVLYVKYSDYIKVNKLDKVTIKGKQSKFGFLVQELL